MSRTLKVNQGNYRLQVQSGGNITLDPGSSGSVTIIGNLDVKGVTTTVESSTTTLADNIIQLNYGQNGNGISSTVGYQSGVQVVRGNYSPAQLVFDETVSHALPTATTVTATATTVTTNLITLTALNGITIGSTIIFSGSVFGNVSGSQLYYVVGITGSAIQISTTSGGTALALNTASGSMTGTVSNLAGTWLANTADGNLSGLAVSTLVSGSSQDLVVDLQNNGKLFRIANAASYATLGLASSDNGVIVSKGMMTTYVAANNGIASVDRLYYPLVSPYSARIQATTSNLSFYINETLRGYFASTGLQVDNVNVFSDTIQNTSSTAPLKLSSVSTNVEIVGVLMIDDVGSAPTSAGTKSKIYSQSSSGATPGKTGIYFTNSVSTDELVAKNRAVLLSMLF